MTIGERIRYARKAKQMTQTELAEKIGCTRKSIYMYEKDLRCGEGFYLVAKICRVLCVSADWLLGLTDDGKGN